MNDEEKKKPEEQETENSEAPAETEVQEEKTEEVQPEPENAPEQETQEIPETPPELSEIDKLKEENFRLRSQLEANTLGFIPDVIEDAVILAENIVRRNGSDISKALKDVAKKYPAWLMSAQQDEKKNKGGFKIGADSSGGDKTDSDKLSKIFGIKRNNGGI